MISAKDNQGGCLKYISLFHHLSNYFIIFYLFISLGVICAFHLSLSSASCCLIIYHIKHLIHLLAYLSNYPSTYPPSYVSVCPMYLSDPIRSIQVLCSTSTGSTGTNTQLRNELHSHLKPLSSLFRVTDCCSELPVLFQTKSYAAIINIIRFCECDIM